MNIVRYFLLVLLATGCVSTKNTIKTIDENAPEPKLSDGAFVVTELASDPRYGYDPDYPVNVFYRDSKDENKNAERYLNALRGPAGEAIIYSKVDSCCPFATKHSEMGAGFVDIYAITYEGLEKPVMLYVNIYAKGRLMIPVGFSAAAPRN